MDNLRTVLPKEPGNTGSSFVVYEFLFPSAKRFDLTLQRGPASSAAYVSSFLHKADEAQRTAPYMLERR